MRLSTFIKKAFFPIILILIGIIISFANYYPGTWISGWDTLHPEFNFSLSFSRLLAGVWRADQGLGAVAGHSHMAELPRVIILWLLSIVFPLSSLRYLFLFLCLLIGPLGSYFFLKYLFKDKSVHYRGIAFLGSLAYLANLATAQQFIVPFEMFTVQFAVLPWIFLYAYRYLKEHSKMSLVLFCIWVFLGSPMAYAATLWYAFFGCFVFVIGLSRKWKHIFILIIVTLCLNSYWLLPNVYFAIYHGTDVQESKINRLFSKEAFAINQLYGNPIEAAIAKSFLFDWQIYNPNSFQFEEVMSAWQTNLNNPIVLGFGYAVFIVALAGVISLSQKKNRYLYVFLPVLIIPFLALLNGIWPISVLYEQIGNFSPVIQEALRFPFTKFSLLYTLGLSVFFAQGIFSIFHFFRYQKNIILSFICIVTSGFLLYFAPAFTGNLIHPAIRITIPASYFDMFSWFNTQKKTDRVAILPINSFWGWVYYDWGYQGSGFLQFGIPQPILDRDYDRWDPGNEQYEHEMSYAVYSQDPQKIETVLRKFNIRWILVDSSVVAPGNTAGSTLEWLIPSLLERIKNVQKVKNFSSKLSVYEYTGAKDQITVSSNLPSVGPIFQGGPEDYLFANIGDYETKSVNSFNDPARTYFTKDERYIGPISPNVVYSANSSSTLVPIASCGNPPQINGTRIITGNEIQYTSIDGPLCDHFSIPQLDHSKAYVFELVTQHEQGFPFELCITNDLTDHCDVFTHLDSDGATATDRFYLAPRYDYGYGYTVNMNNYSIRGKMSKNSLLSLVVYQIDQNIIFPTSKEITPYKTTYTSVPVKSISNAYYQADIAITNTESTIILNQRYEQGWQAYRVNPNNWAAMTFPFLFGKQIPDHILINNWANGWSFDSKQPTTVVIFFLPQLLEWLGFILLPLPFILIFLKKKSRQD